METKIIKSLIVLGVPGVLLGIFFLLFREFEFEFDTISSTWAAIIAIIFLVVVGLITFYGLQQWSPHRNDSDDVSNDSGNSKYEITTEYQQAAAFQISWLIMSLLSNNARHPEALYEQIEVHSRELDINLPSSFKDQIHGDDGGSSAMKLVSSLGGQLVAKQPKLTPYFEAGFNLPLTVGKTGGKDIIMHIEVLDIPNQLRKPQDNPLIWINKIHEYFENILRNKQS